MSDGHEFNDDRLPEPDNKPSSRVDTGRPVYNRDRHGMVYTIVGHVAVGKIQNF